MKQINIKPLEYITPSLVFALERCFLQVAFGLDEQYKSYQISSPYARLGQVVHYILEQVSKGFLQDTDEAEWEPLLLKMWLAEVKKHEQQVLASEDEQHYGVAERWPRYSLQKVCTIHKALEIASGIKKSVKRINKGEWKTEKNSQAFDGKLRGRADGVYQSEHGAEIIDYKTGNIYDEDENGQRHLKTNYRRQLLLYATLHHAETGEWPSHGHIVPLIGQQVTIEIDPIEAEKEAATALYLLAQFNESVAGNVSFLSLAQPLEENCQYCAYEKICPIV
ncbi:MAG: PD-(D/E)XK nuclease family protein [Anaerolineales bacterium]|nr:PD-(D/E)XK nuclease family protein [Anaerolineales bacterium]